MIASQAVVGLLAGLLAGCGPPPPDPACELAASPGPRDAAPAWTPAPAIQTLAADGPYPTAASIPLDHCPDRLRTPDRTRLFATWPTADDAAATGRADVRPGRWPVVVFAHGAHKADCHDLHRAFQTLHRSWASAGAIVLSVDLAEIGCDRIQAADLQQRAAGLGRVLSALDELDAAGPLAGHIDRDRVVLAGHSRGAGAALMAAADWPVAGVMALQPVDVTHSGVVPRPIAVPALVVMAEGDTDVTFPHGQTMEQLLTGPYAWAGIVGGVHAYSSDRLPLRKRDAPQVSREAQLQSTAAVTRAFLGGVVHGWEEALPWVAGQALGEGREDAPIRLRWASGAAGSGAEVEAAEWTAEGFDTDEEIPAYDPRSWDKGRLYDAMTTRRLVAADEGTLCAAFPTQSEPVRLSVQAARDGETLPTLRGTVDGADAALVQGPTLADPYGQVELVAPPGSTRACLHVQGALRLRRADLVPAPPPPR